MLLLGPRTSPLLHGGDPAPGDSERIMAVVRGLREIGRTAGDTASLIGSLGDTAQWSGPAAEAFAARRQKLMELLHTAQSAYTDAADVLHGWHGRLLDLQADAARVAAEAERLRQSAAAENPASVFATIGSADPPGLVALQRRRDDVAHRASREAQRCARDLAAAVKQVKRFEHSTWQHITKELVKASDILGKVSSVLGPIAFVLAFVPVVGQGAAIAIAVIEVTALAVNALKLATDVTLAASGEGDWGEVGMGALAVGLGTGGKAVGGLAKAARAENRLRAGASAAQSSGVNAAHLSREAGRAHGEVARPLSSIAKDFAHPLTAAKDAAATEKLAREAENFHKLPFVERWVVPRGQSDLGNLDLMAKSAEATKTASDAAEITGWVTAAIKDDRGSR